MHESQQTTVPQFFVRSPHSKQADRLTDHHRSVPTKDQILVPETLLKKRKSQEKERADKAQEREQKKKVSRLHNSRTCDDDVQSNATSYGDDVPLLTIFRD